MSFELRQSWNLYSSRCNQKCFFFSSCNLCVCVCLCWHIFCCLMSPSQRHEQLLSRAQIWNIHLAVCVRVCVIYIVNSGCGFGHIYSSLMSETAVWWRTWGSEVQSFIYSSSVATLHGQGSSRSGSYPRDAGCEVGRIQARQDSKQLTHGDF